MSAIRQIAFVSLLALGVAAAASAQKLEQPKIEIQKTQITKIKPTAPLNTTTFQHNYAGGDMATYWISPLLTNHDSRISNNIYKVDGKTFIEKFSFSVVNSSLEPLEVSIDCQNEAGVTVPKYSAKLQVAAYGAATWNVNNIDPARSTDSVTPDKDRVWCGLTANRPFAAFGAMQTGSDASGVSAVSLIAAAR